MGFKTANQYEEEKYAGKFRLADDGDMADVIPLYQSKNDVLIADVHYIKSADYSGYVHCCGTGCPACSRGIRRQTKLFIPLYNVVENEIQFWDRTQKFLPQVHKDFFGNDRYPNPSEFVYRITRNGAAGDMATRYTIMVVGKNTTLPYDMILSNNKAVMPDYYEHICKEVDAGTLSTWIDSASSGNSYGDSSNIPEYVPVPRAYASSGENTATTPTNEDFSELPDSSMADVMELDDSDVPF